ncbi:MAG TPA: hypothetical protein VF282_01340, partial [Bacillota bacterium]
MSADGTVPTSAAAAGGPATLERPRAGTHARPAPGGRERGRGRQAGDGRSEGRGDPRYLDQDRGHIVASIVLSFVALFLGGLYGPLQSLDKMGINLYPYLPGIYGSYYLGLTLHGVALAL